MDVVTRFPPSPTGTLHIGGARTALFNYLFAKHAGGKIHLRLEDTDEERSRPEYEENILESLRWLGLSFDPIGKAGAPFWRQSERKEVYRAYLKKLIDGGKAYVSKEMTTPQSPPLKGGEGQRRSEVIRFKNPDRKIAFDDRIRGRIEFDTTELGDMVIAKSLEEPLYHLAVVVDDFEMGVTHVLRGEDHISNTPRQIMLQETFGFPRPAYAHIPLILAHDRSKLSKRHGAVSVTEYRDRGYLSEALINYLALVGWNPGTDEEIFSRDELVRRFDLSKVQKGGAVFSEEKLRWFNKEYLKQRGGAVALLPHIPAKLTEGRNEAQARELAEMLFERVSTYGDMRKGLEAGEYDYLRGAPTLDSHGLSWHEEPEPAKTAANLERACNLLMQIPEGEFTKENIREKLWNAEKERRGCFLWPIRFALSGKEKSPDPFTIAAILGKAETLRRLLNAVSVLSEK